MDEQHQNLDALLQDFCVPDQMVGTISNIK
jgi:hypothetical protein